MQKELINFYYNLYYQAIYQVVDWYFNRYNPKLEKINQKISNFSKKLQNSYERLIIALKNQKEELKQNIISNKIYQQKVVPINRKIRDYKHKIYWFLDRFKTRFFSCRELRYEHKAEVFDKGKVRLR
jgi:uncharacterized protein YdcH (DUF465 family)